MLGPARRALPWLMSWPFGPGDILEVSVDHIAGIIRLEGITPSLGSHGEALHPNPRAQLAKNPAAHRRQEKREAHENQ